MNDVITEMYLQRMGKMKVLYIIMPAYNEEQNIENVIVDWYSIVEKYNGNGKSRLVVIDDGSKDRTYEIVKKCAENRPLLIPITKQNSGHGGTVLYGYQYALKNDADYVFQTDSDGQTIAEEFHQFWEQKEQFDMLIGLRSKRQDGFSRVIVTKVLKLVIRVCFGINVVDANTPYRLMKADSLKKAVEQIPEGFNLSNVLVAVFFEKRGMKTKYIPITFRPRQGGKNSINIKSIVKIGYKAVGDFANLNKQMK